MRARLALHEGSLTADRDPKRVPEERLNAAQVPAVAYKPSGDYGPVTGKVPKEAEIKHVIAVATLGRPLKEEGDVDRRPVGGSHGARAGLLI